MLAAEAAVLNAVRHGLASKVSVQLIQVPDSKELFFLAGTFLFDSDFLVA
jgi:hypothetical protein